MFLRIQLLEMCVSRSVLLYLNDIKQRMLVLKGKMPIVLIVFRCSANVGVQV